MGICAIMQFVFYSLLKNNSTRLDIGESESERKEYAETALWTGIIYSGLIVVSAICIGSGYTKQRPYIGLNDNEDDENQHLINDWDNNTGSYESTSPNSHQSSDNKL